jgi:nucleotidyltransferase substrate binding protein (TIGR01987 family)
MSSEDIRWTQRFQNFIKAFALLEEAVEINNRQGLSDLEEQGLIQRFEFTHELAWNVFKDYFDYQGNTQITGSRDATREAFNKGLIQDGEGWMEMIKSRNQSSHTYNEEVAADLKNKITKNYHNLFRAFKKKMAQLEKQ